MNELTAIKEGINEISPISDDLNAIKVNKKGMAYTLNGELEPVYLSEREKFIVECRIKGMSYKDILSLYRNKFGKDKLSEFTIGRWLKRPHVKEYMLQTVLGKASYEYYKNEENRAKEIRNLDLAISEAKDKNDLGKLNAKINLLHLIGKLFGGSGSGVSIENQQINFYQANGRA